MYKQLLDLAQVEARNNTPWSDSLQWVIEAALPSCFSRTESSRRDAGTGNDADQHLRTYPSF